MTKGEKNFIESKDTLNYNFPTNCLLHGTLLVFVIAEILLYVLKFEYLSLRSSIFGYVFAIVIAVTDILNVLLRICMRKKYQHAYYGVCIVLISLYLNYFTIKVGTYPFNQLLGLIAVVTWIITSLVLIYAIIDNIKNDRYNDDSNSIYFFKKQSEENNGKKYGIVITKYNIIHAVIYIIVAIVLIILYFVKKEIFNVSGDTRIDFAQSPLIIFLFVLCYVVNHGWKLIIKQIYVNKITKEHQTKL